ncbi:MAG: hypothetical protein J6X86_06650 [Bacteroidales bacterium]|nr:hypothetical protein [Bacteroidales bacterium]
MKKKILIIACLVLMGGFSAFFFGACDKDTDCYVEITVVDEVTKKPVKDVFVKIDIDSSYVSSEGYTDANGMFKTSFKAPAIFNVSAKYETGYDSVYTRDVFYCYRKGNNTIRLKEGEVVKATVNLESTIIREYRNK